MNLTDHESLKDVRVTQIGNPYHLTAEEVNLAIHYLSDVELLLCNHLLHEAEDKRDAISNGVYSSKAERLTHAKEMLQYQDQVSVYTETANRIWQELDALYQVFWHIMVFSDPKNVDRFYY